MNTKQNKYSKEWCQKMNPDKFKLVYQGVVVALKKKNDKLVVLYYQHPTQHMNMVMLHPGQCFALKNIGIYYNNDGTFETYDFEDFEERFPGGVPVATMVFSRELHQWAIDNGYVQCEIMKTAHLND